MNLFKSALFISPALILQIAFKSFKPPPKMSDALYKPRKDFSATIDEQLPQVEDLAQVRCLFGWFFLPLAFFSTTSFLSRSSLLGGQFFFTNKLNYVSLSL